jgi:hypothetical protein
MFTMYSSKMSPSLTSALGVDAVLSKPNAMGHLVESINAVFEPALRQGGPCDDP